MKVFAALSLASLALAINERGVPVPAICVVSCVGTKNQLNMKLRWEEKVVYSLNFVNPYRDENSIQSPIKPILQEKYVDQVHYAVSGGCGECYFEPRVVHYEKFQLKGGAKRTFNFKPSARTGGTVSVICTPKSA